MMDYINKLANNDYILTGLIILLIVLVIIFFIVLFFSGKKNSKDLTIDKNDDSFSGNDSNIDFNHDEFVKETTAEFELAPVEEIAPNNDSEREVFTEESPAYKLEDNISISDGEMNNFSFDDLSKMISVELEKNESEESFNNLSTKAEDIKGDANIPEVTFVDTFKEVESTIKPVEVEKVENIADVFKKEEAPSLNSVFIDKKVETVKEEEIVLPKLADAYLEKLNNNSSLKEEENKVNDALIKDEVTPLYTRFNQETYDINQKD